MTMKTKSGGGISTTGMSFTSPLSGIVQLLVLLSGLVALNVSASSISTGLYSTGKTKLVIYDFDKTMVLPPASVRRSY
jgi:hypothetical protein